MQRQITSGTQDELAYLVQLFCRWVTHAPKQNSCSVAGYSDEQAAAGPNISRLAPHVQQEWDHAANAYLGWIAIAPHSNIKAWWRSGLCNTRNSEGAAERAEPYTPQ